MATKRALIVGIERYSNPRNNLPGVSNDVSAFMRILNKYDITDVEVIRDANATSENIRSALHALVADAGADDVRIFYYSGHGVLLPKGYVFGDDPDGRDEAMVPFEGTTSSLILDNWIGKFLKEKLLHHTVFYSILDCCYSGEMYKGGVVLDESFRPPEEIAKEIDFTTLVFAGNPLYLGSERSENYSIKKFVLEEENVNSIHIAASSPDEASLILTIDGQRRSVFTWALEQILEPGMVVVDLEPKLIAKQAEQTSRHKPFVISNESNKTRVMFT